MNSKILSGILGLCVADALGVPVEFKSRASLKANPVRDMRGFGTYGQPAGTWSDDTSMTLCLAESLADRDGLDYQDIMNNFSAWLHEGQFTPHGKAFDVGRTCARAIHRFDDGIEPRLCGSTSEFENGNGSLMRVLPIAFYLRQIYGPDFAEQDEAMDMIHQVSALTHAHPRAMAACGIYIAIAGRLMNGLAPVKAVQAGLEQARAYYGRHGAFSAVGTDFARLYDPGFASFPESEIRSTGYVVDTLEASIWCLLNSDSYRDCVLLAVNLGEDTDSVGAVAGGLAGLAYGCASLPEEWLHAIVQRAFVEEICQKLALGLERIAVRRLCRFLPYFETATRDTVCLGSILPPGGTAGLAAEESPVLVHPKYSQTMTEFVQAFMQSSLADPDYLDLAGDLDFESVQEIVSLVETADLALTKALLTGIIRQERFCTGLWAEAMDERLFYRILKHLAELEGIAGCLQTA